jgi:predicted TIM-barrel fold metal-dependent hydrolase
MNPAKDSVSRREFLLQAPAVLAGDSKRLIIDTHLEVWTVDPEFPFHHPEHPDVKPEISAPIENEVEEMRDYGLRYAVLINPRDYGWDDAYISYSLHKYPDRFVAHGLINPEDPKVVARLRHWVTEHGFQGIAIQPAVPSKLHLA